jgi:predicted AAA+ superfamily ATPase
MSNDQLLRDTITLLQHEFWTPIPRKSFTPRLHISPPVPGKIFVAAGMRRTGKTTYLRHLAQNLIAEGTQKESMLWVSFEDDRLERITEQTIGELVKTFYALYPENHSRTVHLFLDEIQVVPQWERTIRRLFDTKDIRIFLTGSSSALLSREIGTALRGRSLLSEVWPYSFREYLLALNHKFDPRCPPGSKPFDLQTEWLRRFLFSGGFPEVLSVDQTTRARTLQEYRDVVIFRDIVERYKVTNLSLLRYLVKSTLFQPGRSFAVHKFTNDCKSQGLAVSKNTVHEYLHYLESCYLVFPVSLYSDSLRKQQVNPKKLYAIDTGMASPIVSSEGRDIGHLFENLVYLDLRREGYEPFYYQTRSGYEVDFLAFHPSGKKRLIQVCFDTSHKETLDREMRALREAEEELQMRGELIDGGRYFRGCP